MHKYNETFLFLYPNMVVGGIEKYVFKFMKVNADKGIRYIWLRYGNTPIYDQWQDFIDKHVEIVDTKINGLHWLSHNKINFKKNEKVTAICFGIVDFARLQTLKRNYPTVDMQTFYIIPHFTMAHYYPEMYFSGITKQLVKKRVAKFYKKMLNNHNLLFFSQKHIDELEKRYCLTIKNGNDLLLRKLEKPEPFNEELAKKRSERKEFRIITCGRFEFPHKGYMIGLIHSFTELKSSYPQLHLDIIGYGAGQTEIEDCINKYPASITKDIHLLGQVEPDDLKRYFDKAHLNISVAGGVISGALSGLLSLPARHYTYQCEVYGFLPESKPYILSSEPGRDVKNYILSTLRMSDDEYVEKCKSSFEACNSDIIADPLWLMEQKNLISKKYGMNIIAMKLLAFYTAIRAKILGIESKIKRKRNIITGEKSNGKPKI